jgi:hypothetical protein
MRVVELGDETVTLTLTLSELDDIILGLSCSLDRMGRSAELSVVQSRQDHQRLIRSFGRVARRLYRKDGGLPPEDDTR